MLHADSLPAGLAWMVWFEKYQDCLEWWWHQCSTVSKCVWLLAPCKTAGSEKNSVCTMEVHGLQLKLRIAFIQAGSRVRESNTHLIVYVKSLFTNLIFTPNAVQELTPVANVVYAISKPKLNSTAWEGGLWCNIIQKTSPCKGINLFTLIYSWSILNWSFNFFCLLFTNVNIVDCLLRYVNKWHALFNDILKYENRKLHSFQFFTSLQEQICMIWLHFFNWNKFLQIVFALFNLLLVCTFGFPWLKGRINDE